MLSMGLETGYQMKKHVESNLGHFWNESYGQIYPILRQLLDEKLVTRRIDARPGKPRRNLYALTSTGWAELAEWLAQPPEPQPLRMELLLKLSFGARAPTSVSMEHLRRYQETCERGLEFLTGVEDTLCANPTIHPDQPYWLMTLRYGKAIRDAERRWCEQTLDHLQRIADDEDGGANERRSTSR